VPNPSNVSRDASLIPIIEVAAVAALIFPLRATLRALGFNAWQEPLFGAAPISAVVLFFLLPLVFVLAARRSADGFGLTTHGLGYHGNVALRALMVVAPATVLFVVVVYLGSDPMQWIGGIILSLGFAAGGFVMLRTTSAIPTASLVTIDIKGLLAYVGLLASGLVLVGLVQTISPLASRAVAALLFVGFLEEVFFRGYLQTRLNEQFGTPFQLRGVRFGIGLLIAAAVFGLMHPLSVSGDSLPWPWALWTATLGLILGFLREKTGGAVAPAIVHGVILLPGVFFGPG
jgi:membrane protease YdiL (CAAX protease family)